LKIHYRYRETFYHITIRNGGSGLAVKRVVVDGGEQAEMSVSLVDDRSDHNVEVEVG
jgi:cellobiose phosphorylase